MPFRFKTKPFRGAMDSTAYKGAGAVIARHPLWSRPPVSLRKSQLRAPGDIADHLRLPLLALLEHNAHAGRKAIIPRRLD